MKKLGKLQINPEKIIKNEELLTLRGGYDYHGCWCFDSGLGSWGMVWMVLTIVGF